MSRGRSTWLVWCGALVGILALLAWLDSALLLTGDDLAAAEIGPIANASLSVASPGQLEHITGSGWADVGGVVTVQICGQDAVNLTADCDESNTYSAGIRTGGVFYAALFVRLPIEPCPCVIYVTNQLGQSYKIPVEIVGAPLSPIVAPLQPFFPVALRASLSTPTSISSWFGGPRNAVLRLRVTNHSMTALWAPVVTVRIGRRDPSQLVAGETIGTVPQGASRALQIPVTIPAVTFGHYTVLVQLRANGESATTSVHTSSWPWAWLIAAIELILLLTAAILRRVHRRRLARTEFPNSDTAPGSGPPTPPLGTPLVAETGLGDTAAAEVAR
jgi:hypothetical protein